MISSYVVLALAIAAVLFLKYYLVNRAYQNKMVCYIDPKTLADDIVSKTLKQEGQKVLREKFSIANLTDVIKGNLVYLRVVEPGEQQDQAIQKLRNICLCIEIGLNKEVTGEQEVQKLPATIEQLVRAEHKQLQRLVSDSEKPSLQQVGINRYVRYLLSFLPEAKQ